MIKYGWHALCCSFSISLKLREGPHFGQERRLEEAMIFSEEQLVKIEAQQRENPQVEHLIAQRNQLLKDHPHLRELQEEVDALLSTTINPVIRLEILFMLMTDRHREMRAVFTELIKMAYTASLEK